MAQPHECQLLGPFGWIIQIVLGIVSFSSLLLKRQAEKIKRPWLIFFLDSSKQAVGAFATHIMNMMFAIMISHHNGADSCDWYWINIVVDCTLGVIIAYGLLQAFKQCACFRNNIEFGNYNRSVGDSENPLSSTQEGLTTGDREDVSLPHGVNTTSSSSSTFTWSDIDYSQWVLQTICWLTIVVTMKTIVLFFMLVYSTILNWIAQKALPFDHQPKLKLIIVMIVTPFLMNVFQFWITDSFIKLSKQKKARDFARRASESSTIS